jgi:hypothetical protein
LIADRDQRKIEKCHWLELGAIERLNVPLA